VESKERISLDEARKIVSEIIDDQETELNR
jgi:hypothetical protein